MNQWSLLALGMVLTVGAMPVTSQVLALPEVKAEVEDCFRSAERAVQASAEWSDIRTCVAALDMSLAQRERVVTLVNLAIILVDLGDYDEAERRYQQAEVLSVDYADLYLNRGNLRYLKQDFAAAAGDYSEALRLNAAQAHLAHLNRGMALQNLGRFSEAESDYRAALSLRPQWSLVAQKLAELEGVRQPTSIVSPR